MDEDIKTEKKLWQRPELIVLVRSYPEEAVLTFCKYQPGGSGKGPAANNNGCNNIFIFCSHCSTQGGNS